MQKIVILCFLFLFSFNICSAAVPDELASVLDEYKDLNIRFECGVSYLDYKPIYQKIYVDTRKLTQQHPEYKEDMENLLDVYKDINTLYQHLVQDNISMLEPQMQITKTLNQKYPELLSKKAVTYDGYSGKSWYNLNVISCLPDYGVERINIIEAKYK